MLESRIRGIVARAFRGRLLTGTLRRPSTWDMTDKFGDPIVGNPETYSFDGIREDYRADFRAAAGIPATDVRVLVIAGSLSVEPRQGDQVFIRGKWHEVRRIEDIDPASATVNLQCFEIEEPE